jgi:hypothetical protein
VVSITSPDLQAQVVPVRVALVVQLPQLEAVELVQVVQVGSHGAHLLVVSRKYPSEHMLQVVVLEQVLHPVMHLKQVLFAEKYPSAQTWQVASAEQARHPVKQASHLTRGVVVVASGTLIA